MATQEQLEAALRNAAVKARQGDERAAMAARRFAAELKTMRAGGSAAPPTSPRSADDPSLWEGGRVPSVDPTEGMSGGRLFGAGAGKSLRDTGLGLVQSFSRGGPVGTAITGATEWLGMDAPRNPLAEWADRSINENRQADSALLDDGSALAGNITGVVGQFLAPGGVLAAGSKVRQFGSAAPQLSALSRMFMPTSVKGAATQGAVVGSLAPVAEGDSRLMNTVTGTVGGAVGGALPRLLGAGARGLSRLIEPLTPRGLESIAGRTIQRFARDPSSLNRPLADPILGRAPTLAEATLDPGIAQLQRTAQSKSPEVANAVFDARVAANEGRAAAISRFAGTPEARQAAMDGIEMAEKAAYGALRDVDGVDVVPVVRRVDRLIAGPEGKRPEVRAALTRARSMFFEPYEDAARIKDARKLVADTIGQRMSGADRDALLEARRILANRQGLSADEVVEQLSVIRPQSKTAATALKEAAGLVNSLNVAYESQVPRLIGVRKGINDLIAGKGDSKAGTAAQAELIEIRDALDAAIRKVAPGIDTALDARRVGMRPVNEMDTMSALLQRATVPVPTQAGGLARGLQPSAFLRPTEDLDKLARQGTGFRRADADNVLSPQAQETIEGIRVGLARQQFADTAAKVSGSPTAQFLAGQNIMDAVLGQPKGSLTSGLANLGAAALDKPYAFVGVPERLNAVMARVLTNPQEAQAILARLPPPDRVLLEQAIGRITAPVGSNVLVGQE